MSSLDETGISLTMSDRCIHKAVMTGFGNPQCRGRGVCDSKEHTPRTALWTCINQSLIPYIGIDRNEDREVWQTELLEPNQERPVEWLLEDEWQ